jgi:hypothetical protein
MKNSVLTGLNVRSLLLVYLLFFGSFQAISQRKLLDDRELTARRLIPSSPRYIGDNDGLLSIYAERFGLMKPDSISPDGMILFDIDPNGRPIFMALDETRSGIVVRANEVYPMGRSGLRLTGRGQVVGVFDGGRTQIEHPEFQGRAVQKDNSTTRSNHATHVSGIIAAAGINPNTRGIAYEANIDAYSFSNWQNKIISAAREDVNISNHSYGTVAGWRRDNAYQYQWRWFGDTTVSQTEDWLFGFYNSTARYHDDFCNAYPYHLFVTSAGNSRGQRGPTSAPFDHEINVGGQWVKVSRQRPENGPYDSTPPSGVAKNILTVGAASANDPENFSVASFTSWGPTDDGRIKPDIMGVGVSVLSTLSDSDQASNRYGTMSGTSMSSPNVAGGMALIRQHMIQARNYIPLASTLKAIAIHSAEQHPNLPKGPDYRTGWGMLDVEKATSLITKLDSSRYLLEEIIMTSGESVTRQIYSDGSSPLEVTIVWSDPSGSPPRSGLNPRDTMLVNDLDLKLIGPDGEEFFPYILDPATPNAAPKTGINWLDNVEKIRVEEPTQGTYTIQITHKKEALVNDQQIVSLAGSGGDLREGFNTLFWIGSDGDWNNPVNWSASANGEPVGRIPTALDIVRFENHANLKPGSRITLSANAEALNLFVNTDSSFVIDLNGKVFNIDGSMYAKASLQKIENGELRLTGNNLRFNGIRAGETQFNEAVVRVNANNASWEFESGMKFDRLIIEGGRIDLSDRTIEVRDLIIGSNGANVDVNLTNTRLEGLQNFIVQDSDRLSLRMPNSEVNFDSEGEVKLAAAEIAFGKLNIQAGNAIIQGNIFAEEASIMADVYMEGLLEVERLEILNVGEFSFGPGAILAIGSLELNNPTAKSVSWIGDAEKPAQLFVAEIQKICFDDIRVENVKAKGNGTLNAGPNAVLSGVTDGWFNTDCERVLFVDFSYAYNCFGNETIFTNMSTGEISDLKWTIKTEDGNTLRTVEDENFGFKFAEVGSYSVSLRVTDTDGNTREILRSIEIIPNTLGQLILYDDGGSLAASIPDVSYQWFKNGVVIEGATGRFFTPLESGIYRVMASNGQCSAMSNDFEYEVQIVSIGNEPVMPGVNLFPNPTEGMIRLILADEFRGLVSFNILSMSGAVLKSWSGTKTEYLHEEFVTTEQLKSGSYLIQADCGGRKITKRLIKQ